MTTTIYGVTPTSNTKDEIINASTDQEVFGTAYPLYDKANSTKGIFRKTKGFELFKSEVRQFIKTQRGERVMLPNFGLSLKRFLFEPVTDDLISSMKKEIIVGIGTYLPAVNILRLSVNSNEKVSSNGLPGMTINLLIASKITNERGELSIPL
jgi:phage baseplate assembly protein W